MAFKMKNPISNIANTKSHGTNANFARSAANMENMKSSPAEWAWLGALAKGAGKAIATGAKVAGKAAKVAGKAVGKGAKAVGKGIGKAVKGGGKKGAAEAVTTGAKETVKKGIGSKIKDQAIGAARDAVTSAATDALKPKEKEHKNPTEGFNVQFK